MPLPYHPQPVLARLACSAALALPLWAGAAAAEVPQVVTDIPPVQSLVAMVMGDLGTPGVLLPQGGDPHSYQLRPSQARDLSEAGLVVWVGPELTPWLDRALTNVTSSGTTQLGLLATPGTILRAFAEDSPETAELAEEAADAQSADGAGGGHDHDHADDHDHAHDHADDHTHDHDHDHDHDHAEDHGHDHGHDHGFRDPHAWLDPQNAQVWLRQIAETLGQIDPEHAALYAQNALVASERLATLDSTLQAELAPVRDKPFLVSHDAYRYFVAHYGLTQGGTISLGDAAAPGAARLSRLRGEMQAARAVCAFPEANHDPKQMAQLIEGTPVRQGAAIDPAGSTLTPGADLYERLLKEMASALRDCLSAG
ncbi:zinc ABC transporter substrate-binding protein [Phaeovulum sp. W22_SRMD_FR3]|uniref:zinc ABC transporter substrate-binding protein n=1 Tax=Phaeovulum sp. W22_SRMD_FR3 TaxID=3240274 RepID=UPI003F9D62F4